MNFTYQYVLNNAVINWKDTAELNFKVIGDGWETELNNIKVTINCQDKMSLICKLGVMDH